MNTNLFIGGLFYDTTEDELREFFSPCGKVNSVKILMDRETGRSKGAGFVRMSTQEEAKAAIERLSGKVLGGRKVFVSEAHPSPLQPGFVERRSGKDRRRSAPSGQSPARKEWSPKPGDGPKKPWGKRPGDGPKKPWVKRPGDGPKKPWDKKPGDGPKKPWEKRPGDGPKKPWDKKPGDGPKKPWDKKPGGGPKKPWDRKPGGGPKKSWTPKPGGRPPR